MSGRTTKILVWLQLKELSEWLRKSQVYIWAVGGVKSKRHENVLLILEGLPAIGVYVCVLCLWLEGPQPVGRGDRDLYFKSVYS